MDDFVLLSEPRGPNLESAVEHFLDFLRFCSIFRTACPKFGEPGRQKSHISPVFCLLSRPRALEIPAPDYGQNGDFCDLPVNSGF